MYVEIGCNHRGDPATALAMIDVAAACGVDGVKFQKRCPSELLSPEEYAAPHPDARHAYGPSYGLHREALELGIDVHAALAERARSLGIGYGCSVWDLTSAAQIASLGPDWIKIPSALNTDLELIEVVCSSYDGPLHVSLGMTTRREEERLLERIDGAGRLRDTVLYACTSGYPVQPAELCLGEISRLHAEHGDRVAAVGFSGHHTGTAPDVAAFALGACYIERHFTLDRRWRGTDHAASLEPADLTRLCRELGEVAPALQVKGAEILPVEQAQRAKLKRFGRPVLAARGELR
ncbi:MAG: N-acetylneuraminate synthase family protein [Acidimicrobiales bacterium]